MVDDDIMDVAVPDNNDIHEPHIIHIESEKEIEISLKLDYNKIQQADPTTSLTLMKDLFITGLSLCNDTHLAQFDWQSLQKDVITCFSK